MYNKILQKVKQFLNVKMINIKKINYEKIQPPSFLRRPAPLHHTSRFPPSEGGL